MYFYKYHENNVLDFLQQKEYSSSSINTINQYILQFRFSNLSSNIIVHRSKKPRNVWKANTVVDVPKKTFVLSYQSTFHILILHHLFKRKKLGTCMNEARNRHGIIFWKFLMCNLLNFCRNAEETHIYFIGSKLEYGSIIYQLVS